MDNLIEENGFIFFHLLSEQNAVCSNWYPSKFVFKDVSFSSVEQYLMYQKAILFEDCVVATQIMDTDSPEKIKKLGRKVNGFREDKWASARWEIGYNGVFGKFSQDSKLREVLLKSNGMFAECAVMDKIWGIGLSMNDPKRFNCSRWRGDNLLGNILAAVRDELCSQ